MISSQVEPSSAQSQSVELLCSIAAAAFVSELVSWHCCMSQHTVSITVGMQECQLQLFHNVAKLWSIDSESK